MPDCERIAYLRRSQINNTAWDACVTTAPNQIFYGFSWYLDAVTCLPDWTWVGLVLRNQPGSYQAVMPVPLRRRFVLGVAVGWVVHQPLFCQFLPIFGPSDTDKAPFFRALLRRFRYGSILHTAHRLPADLGVESQRQHTHLLDLNPPYAALSANYSADRRVNLNRAHHFGWQIQADPDPEPLIRLFRKNHAGQIPGGVGDWAYTVFRDVVLALQKRGMAHLHYACHAGQIEAGALFVLDRQRVVYLFNAASSMGRRGNARTLLLDMMIRENADTPGLWFDFESPDKPSVVQFYQSFGTAAEPFWTMRWNRLSRPERAFLRLLKLYPSGKLTR